MVKVALRHRADARHRLPGDVPFLIGITKGKWGTLLTNLLAFKRAYDSNRPLAEVLPEIAAQYPDRYRNVRLHDLGDELFEYLRTNRPATC